MLLLLLLLYAFCIFCILPPPLYSVHTLAYLFHWAIKLTATAVVVSLSLFLSLPARCMRWMYLITAFKIVSTLPAQWYLSLLQSLLLPAIFWCALFDDVLWLCSFPFPIWLFDWRRPAPSRSCSHDGDGEVLPTLTSFCLFWQVSLSLSPL